MAQVFKIKFKDTLRRISAPLSKDGDAEGFGYDDLELKVRDLFQIPSTSRVALTYTDGEDDVVTMADDQDLKDACLTQKLNPLKLEVKAVKLQAGGETKGNEPQPNTTEFNVEALLKGLFPESTSKAIERVLSRYPPCLFTTVPAHVLPEALDTFLGTLAAGNRENTTKAQRGDRVINARGLAVHKYIECDCCFACPIVGPRYKSMKKHDYDLCSNCFKKFGNAMDYRKLDRPFIAGFSNSAVSFEGEKDQSSFNTSSLSRENFTEGPFRWVPPLPSKPDCVVKDVKGSKRALDAEFVMDVTILDGSEVEVGSTFSKIWRLKNPGVLPWPQHTQLVHIGGTILGSPGVVTLKLPSGGLPCESELDVSVELKAPEYAGMYVANFRLMAPSGQMFGDSVWVLIEAVADCKRSQTCELEESHVDKGPKESLSEAAKISDSLLQDMTGCEEGDMAGSQLGEVGYKSASVLIDSNEQYGETDGFSLVESVGNGLVEERESLTATEEFELVGALPQEFASGDLGFKQNDANIEPPQNSVSEDDSLASTGWDHMFKELEELGFHDTRTNVKELLLKSEGSIKKAVKELVELEKQTSGKIKAA